jgi:hypothetical protein
MTGTFKGATARQSGCVPLGARLRCLRPGPRSCPHGAAALIALATFGAVFIGAINVLSGLLILALDRDRAARKRMLRRAIRRGSIAINVFLGLGIAVGVLSVLGRAAGIK